LIFASETLLKAVLAKSKTYCFKSLFQSWIWKRTQKDRQDKC